MRNYIALLLALVMLVSGCSSSKDERSLFDRGLSLLDSGEYKEALKIFSTLDSTYANSVYGAYGRALSYDKDGLIAEATDAYRKLINKHPDYSPAVLSFTQMAIRNGESQLAVEMAKKYMETEGEKGPALALMAEALMVTGDLKSAGELLSKGLSSGDNNPLVLLAAAKYYLHFDSLSKSSELSSRAIKEGNGDTQVLKGGGDYFALRGQLDSASYYYNRALASNKKAYYLKAEIAESFIKIGYLHDAEKILKGMPTKSDTTHCYFALKSLLEEKRGKPWNARQTYEDAMVIFRNSPTVLKEYAIKRIRTNDIAGADRFMMTALNAGRQNAYIKTDLASLRLDHLEVLLEAKGALEISEPIKAMMNDFPDDFHVLYLAAPGSIKYAPPEEASRILAELRKQSTGNPFRLTQLGYLYFKADSLNRAGELFREAIKMDKINYPAILGMIAVYKGENKIVEALAFLDGLAGDINNNFGIAREKIGLYRLTGDLPRAAQLAEKSIDVAPGDIERYRLASELAYEMGSHQKVEEICRRGIENNPDDPAAYALAGDYYLNAGNYDEAERNINKALALDTLFIDGYILRGRKDTLQGKFEEALAIFERASQMDQYSSEAFNNLAWLMIRQGGNIQQAANNAMVACSYSGFKPVYLRTLGVAYNKMGRYDMARGAFEKALKFAPDDPILSYYAGLNYIKDGKPDKAKECLQNALNKGLTGQLKSDAMQSLQSL